MIACMALIAFFAFIVLRALALAARNPDPFCRLAAAGLTVMFGGAKPDQHGGQPARHAGQGHDLAVHLLRRLVAAGARPRHGLPGRRDAQASGRRSRPSRGGRRDEPGAPDPACGGRHRRTSLSRRGAGRRRCAKRGAEVELATDSRALKFGQDFPARADSRLSRRDDDRRRRARQGARVAHSGRGPRGGGVEAPAHPAARGRRLRRLSDRAAASRRLAPSDSGRPARAERGDGPRQSFPEPARRPHRLRLS